MGANLGWSRASARIAPSGSRPLKSHERSARAPARRGRGFSLIELLVALSMLMVLVGIMLPSLHHVMRHQAPLVRCSNNLHQIHQALTLYLDESRDAMPRAGYDPMRDPGCTPLNRTLARHGVGHMAFWICAADSRPESIRERWGSELYPAGKLLIALPRLQFSHLGTEFPLIADRGPFHLVTERTQIVTDGEDGGDGDDDDDDGGRGDGDDDPVDEARDRLTQSGFYEGHNALLANGKVTCHATPRPSRGRDHGW